MVSRTPVLQSIIHDDALMKLTPREALRTIGSNFLSTLGDPVNRMLFRVIIGEALREPSIADVWKHFGLLPGLTALTHYLTRQMQAGQVRVMDPSAAANCFLGPLFFYVLTRTITDPADLPALQP